MSIILSPKGVLFIIYIMHENGKPEELSQNTCVVIYTGWSFDIHKADLRVTKKAITGFIKVIITRGGHPPQRVFRLVVY